MRRTEGNMQAECEGAGEERRSSSLRLAETDRSSGRSTVLAEPLKGEGS